MIRTLAVVSSILLVSSLTVLPRSVVAGTLATAPYPCHMGARMLHVNPTSRPGEPHASMQAAIPGEGKPSTLHSMRASRLQCVSAIASFDANATLVASAVHANLTDYCLYISASLSLSENGPAFSSDAFHMCHAEFTNGLPVGVPVYYRLTISSVQGIPLALMCPGGEVAHGSTGSFTIPESALGAKTPYFVPVLKVSC